MRFNTINCRLCPVKIPGSTELKLCIVALPGVRVIPGEELYASYKGNYWLDQLPLLPPDTRRACIRKYKYSPSALSAAGLLRNGSRSSDSTQSIRPILVPQSPPLSTASTRVVPDRCYPIEMLRINNRRET